MTSFVENTEGKISFDDTGENSQDSLNKPVLVCTPGMGDLRSQYRHLSVFLIAAGYRVVTIDLRGFGETQGNWKSFTPKDVGSDTLSVIESLHIDNKRGVVIIGNSLSSASAIWVAAEKTELVKAIVLTGPFVRDQKVNFFLKGLLRLLLTNPWGPSAWGSYYRTLYITNPPEDLDEHIHQIVKTAKEPGRLVSLRKQGSASKQSCTERIPETKCAVLVVMGEKDPDFNKPKDEVDWIVSAFHQEVDSVIIPGAGHYPQSEYPKEVSSHILEFLSKVTQNEST